MELILEINIIEEIYKYFLNATRSEYMVKIRHVIVGIASIIYLILFIMKIEMPRILFIILPSIVLISQAIDEWLLYKRTKKKIHLLIPVTFSAIIIFLVLYVLF